MGAVAMHAMDYGREVHITPKALEDFYLIQVPVTGSACIGRGSRKQDIGVGEASLLPAIDQIEMTWRADCRHLVLQIDRSTLEREAELLNDAPLRSPLDFDIRVCWSDPAMASVRGAAVTLYETWKSNRAQACLPAVQETLSRAFCQLLLLSQPSNHQRLLCAPRSHRLAPRQVRRAEDFIRENLARNVSIEEIARAAGVSPRCLFDSFRNFRGITPMQYLREQRLDAVKHDLCRAGPGETVTSVATRWGVSQLGRFSAEYRQRFGENPSATLQQGGVAR
jgi:AraC-like DNA-binding protein